MEINQISFKISDVDYSKHIVFPVKWNDLLDERLDEARVSLRAIQQEVFQPLLPVTITLKDFEGNTKQLDYVISGDLANELPPGSGLYNHELVLIEQTKILEGFLVDTMTFTNDLGRNYTSAAVKSNPVLSGSSATTEAYKPADISSYITPILIGQSFTFVSPIDVFPWHTYQTKYIKVYENNILKFDGGYSDSYTLKITNANYKVEYTWELRNTPIPVHGGATYYFVGVSNTDPLPKWNIASVIDRVLSIAETRRDNQAPRFHLDPEQRERLAAIEAPEFAFTSDTLKEVLDQIGGFIHAIPRLNGSTIHYDFLGETEMSNAASYKYVTNTYSQNVESYCTKLDSRVDNLVNILDSEQGVITDPYNDGYKTVRTENAYVRIQDDNMIIETKYPIYEVKGLKCGFLPGQTVKGGDLTPYVFEEADYSRMSSTGGQYPDSKGYALYFTQGQPNIKGLNLKFPSAISEALEPYTIVKILRNTTGISNLTISDYPKLAFQVSYIPIYSARAEQTKTNIKGMKMPRTLAFNQGANLVETRYYGENMKGVIARLGNVDRVRTFIGRKLTSIPKVGQLFDEDYYISSVAVEFDAYDYKCTMELSKDFNRLSQYIGINSQKRYYEVSEKQAYEREINYTDYLVIGDSVENQNTLFSGTEEGMQYLVDAFIQQWNLYPVSAVEAQGEDSEGNKLSLVVLPVVSNAFGNSVVLTFSYENNYSAGNQAVYNGVGEVIGYFQQGVPYADVYGRMEYLNLNYSDRYSSPSNSDRQTEIGTMLPSGFEMSGNFLSTEISPLRVEKDNKEQLSFNYQLEFVTNRSSIVIGSHMARLCPFVRGSAKGHGAKLYVLPKRISKFADVIDLTGATLIHSFEGTSDCYVEDGRIQFTSQSTTVAGKSWALVDGTTNELLIGENVALEAGQTIPLPVMTPRHIIENL